MLVEGAKHADTCLQKQKKRREEMEFLIWWSDNIKENSMVAKIKERTTAVMMVLKAKSDVILDSDEMFSYMYENENVINISIHIL